MRTFYRLANLDTRQGLWYDQMGNFTGLIHDKFNFCMNNALPMPFDGNTVGFLSATDTLGALYLWFSKDDIRELEQFGYYITIYESFKYKFQNGHYLICQDTSRLVSTHTLNDMELNLLGNKF